MKLFSLLCSSILLLFFAFPVAFSQGRDIRGGRLVLDDGDATPETVTLIAPVSMTGSYTLTLPSTLPAGPFYLTGDASGNLTAENQTEALDDVAWLLGGNEGTGSEFLGTTNAQPLEFRTKDAARMVIDTNGNIGVNTGGFAFGSAKFQVIDTFPDVIPVDAVFGIPVSVGHGTITFSPSVVTPNAAFVGSGNLMFLRDPSDLSQANVLGVGVQVFNGNTIDTVNSATAVSAGITQSDPGSAILGAIGIEGDVELGEGTAEYAVGISGQIQTDGGSILANGRGVHSEVRASGNSLLTSAALYTGHLEVDGNATIDAGYGMLLESPGVFAPGTLSSYVGLYIGNIDIPSGGASAIQYDGNGINAPFVVEADGDVGVGLMGPSARLEVENNSPVIPTLRVRNTDGDGVGVEVAEGRVILSYDAGAPLSIPGDVAVYTVDDGVGSSVPIVGLPGSATNGQILYVLVADADGATVDGMARAAGDKLTYIYANSGWQLFHLN